MTPSQAYAQWRDIGAEPGESESQTIRRFALQFGLNPEDEDELFKAYPDQKIHKLQRNLDFWNKPLVPALMNSRNHWAPL